MNFKVLYRTLSIALGVAMSAGMSASAYDASYYNSCEGKGGQNLLKALASTIADHTVVSYDGLWTLYQTSDVNASGRIWDMYSTKEWSTGEKCGSYKKIGDCYNREHSFPKSWFSKRSPMVSDAFHIYPTDGYVNGKRGNMPYGECANGTAAAPSSGNIKALGKIGTCTSSGYSGTVFEPDDEYKGDFARSYFYMAACYNSQISGWSSPMLAGNSYPAFKQWAVDVLLKWHRQDPVSDKEIARNDAVYARQHNRNPFIDHPEMAEYIWGNKKTQTWSSGAVTEGTINTPVNNSTVDMGTTAVGYKLTTVITVKGTSLSDNVSLSLSSPAFTVSPQTLTAADVCSAAGAKATVTFTPASTGNASATLSVVSGSASSAVTLTATVIEGLAVMDPENVNENGFTARWTYVGDAFTGDKYRLTVNELGGPLQGYPVEVDARAGYYVVDDLEPGSQYTYQLQSRSMTSRVVSVATPAAMPSVSFYYDGDLGFSTTPGEPSEPAELLVDIENIDTDVELSVESPFELSTDRTTWSQQVTLSPVEDRIYMRVNSATAGTFTTFLVARAGDYLNDDVSVKAIVAQPASFLEDFEAKITTSGYDGGEYNGSAATWLFSNVGMYADDDRQAHGGKQCVRFGKNTTSSITMTTDKPRGAGNVSLWAALYSSDAEATVELFSSTDEGRTWQSAGTATITDNTYKEFNFAVNRAGNIRLALRQTDGKRIYVDDIKVDDYDSQSGCDDPMLDYHAWDAFCRDGRLVITCRGEAASAAVHSLDGITRFTGTLPTGETVMTLPAGLYVVVIGDFSRRVLVK